MRKHRTALVAVVALLSTLALVPAGQTNSVFQYRGWKVPDSWCNTHVDSYHYLNCVKAQRVIYQRFPSSTQERAMGVSYCETGGTYNRFATNPSSRTAGLFQIHPGNHGTTWGWEGHGSLTIDSSLLYNSWYNAKVALYMSRGGHDWGQWAGVCQR